MLVSIMWARIVGSCLAINYDTRAICPRLAMESGTGGKMVAWNIFYFSI
jgi:hypothetical protein